MTLLIDKNKIQTLITASASAILKEMFDLVLLSAPDDIPVPTEIIVNVGYSGNYFGSMWVVISTALATQLAASFLGMDKEDIDGELVDDTTKELMSMVCGGVLYTLDRKNKYAITSPKLYSGYSAVSYLNNVPPNAYGFNFTIGDSPVRLIMAVNRP